MLSGVSLTNEKSYLVGKFARVALKTRNLDYNGRLCMVSAGAGNKKAFGLDRGSNNYSDLKHAEVVMICGTNVSETFPTLTHWLWQARDNGAKLVVVDPRLTPIARTADLHLPIRPGRDSALYGAMLHQLIKHDWLDHALDYTARSCISNWNEVRNRYLKHAHVSDREFRQVLKMYCVDIGALTASKLTGLNKNTTHRLYGLLRARVAKAKPLLLLEASRWMKAISGRVECAGAEAEDRAEKLLSSVCSRGREKSSALRS